MSTSTVKAGAAYEAVLVDKVSGNVQTIVNSLNQLEQAFARVSPAAAAVASSMTQISTNMKTASKVTSRTGEMMTAFRRGMSSVTTSISTAGQSIGQTLIHIGNQMRNAGLVATALAGTMAAGFTKAVTTFSRYEAAVEGLRAVFQEGTDDTLKWAEAFSNKAGRSIIETLDGLRTFRAVLSTLDLPGSELDKMSQRLQEMAVDLAAFANITDEEAMTNLLQGLSGSAIDELRKRGISVSDARVKEFAASIGLATDKLTEQQKTLIRYALILGQMEKLGAVGQNMREWFSIPNQLKRVKKAFEDLSIAVGRRFEPIASRLVGIIENIGKAFANLPINVFDQLASTMLIIGGIGGGLFAAGTVLALLGPPLLGISSIFATIAGLIGIAAPIIAALGPIFGSIAVAAAAATIALAAIGAYLFVKAFPLEGALLTLRIVLQGIFDTIKKGIGGISDAIAMQDWESAWRIATLTGKLVFIDFVSWLSAIFFLTIKNAVTNGLKAGVQIGGKFAAKTLFRALNPGVPQNTIDQIVGQLFPASGAGFPSLPDTYRKGVQAELDRLISDVGTRAKIEEKKKKKGIGEDLPTSDGSTNTSNVPVEPIRGFFRSFGDVSAAFARASGLFGPDIASSDKKQDKEIDLAAEQLKVQGEMLKLLAKIRPYVFE